MYGLFGTNLNLLRQEPAFAEIEQFEYNFYVSTKDCVTLSVTADATFTVSDDVYKYTFSVLRPPIPYGDNWSRLPAMYVSKVSA